MSTPAHVFEVSCFIREACVRIGGLSDIATSTALLYWRQWGANKQNGLATLFDWSLVAPAVILLSSKAWDDPVRVVSVSLCIQPLRGFNLTTFRTN